MVLWNNEYNDQFLLDRDFLALLDQDQHKEIFAKIISLDFNENPLEQIEGRVTSGSVSVDGTSSVRRTCSLSLAANELNIHDFYWGLTTKFKLYVGVTNNIKNYYPYKELYKNYPDICWFKMGTYVISSFSTSQGTDQYSISIQGKDKMTLLNGELGGIITPLSWDFGKVDDVQEDGSIIRSDYLIKDIILEAVHEYSQDPYWNIIINDLDDCGLELLEYRGQQPMYLLYDNDENVVNYMTFNLSSFSKQIPDLPSNIIFDKRLSNLDDTIETTPTSFTDRNGHICTIAKIEYGETIGYRTTDLTYAGNLISNVGETVTSMLDKIVAMLGGFEYFYDLEGRFVFQRKRIYIESSFSPIKDDESEGDEGIYVQSIAEGTEIQYSFNNSLLVTSFANSPDFSGIKNDFSLWGVRKGITGIDIPIHLRYAIDSKPWIYVKYNEDLNATKNIYVTKEGRQTYRIITGYELSESIPTWDWRELIYQMSLDYNKYHHNDNFLAILDYCNTLEDGTHVYLGGNTGYENYYIDINGFWRDIYNPDYEYTYSITVPNITDYAKSNKREYFIYKSCEGLTYEEAQKALADWRTIAGNHFYTYNYKSKLVEVSNLSREDFELSPSSYYYIRYCGEATLNGTTYSAIPFDKNQNYYTQSSDEFCKKGEKNYPWSTDIVDNPENLIFWFDFLDDDSEIGQYAVCKIGDRTKAANDNNVKSIYFREVPNIIFVGEDSSIQEEQEKKGSGYTYIQLQEYLENLFSMSTQGKSAMDVLNDWLYSYAYCAESVTLNTLPVYYLEPNTRITVRDDNSGINGEYIITRLSFPLDYNGTMSITATKAVERLY